MAREEGSGTAETVPVPRIRSLTVAKTEAETLSELIGVPSVETQPKKFVAEFVDTDCANKPPLIETETVSDIKSPLVSVEKK
jgi:hypothetical protein